MRCTMKDMNCSERTLWVGQTASFSKTITESDVYLFAGVTGDLNPVHIDAVYADQSAFHKRIAHGMLSAGLISTVLGTRLPGPGTIYLEQQLKFVAPVYIGDTITATIEVERIDPVKRRVWLKTTCTNQDSKLTVTGMATVLPPTDTKLLVEDS